MEQRKRRQARRFAAVACAAALMGVLSAMPARGQEQAPAQTQPVPVAQPGASKVQNPAIELPGLPPDADVFINGSLRGRGLSRVEVILPGTYELLVRRKGFRPWSKSVNLADAQTVQVQPEFQPLKLAIFPVERTGILPSGEGAANLVARATNALGQAASSVGFTVSHSVHVRSLRQSAALGEDLETMPGFERDARSRTGKPQVDFAARKGKELGVDAILYFTLSLSNTPGTNAPDSSGTWRAQIVDPNSRVILEDSGNWPVGPRAGGEISRQVAPLLERFAASLVRAAGKQTIVVLDLEGEEAEPGAVHAIGEALREELRNTGRYTVMERSEEAEILDRLAPKQTICTAVECALEAGKLFGVQKVVAGRVTGLSPTSWKVSVIQVDVATGETITSDSIRHKGSLGSAGGSLAPLANELAVTASPEGTTFRHEQSKWRWKTGLVFGGAAVMGLGSAYLAAEVTASNERQKDNRLRAEQATTLAEYNRWAKKLKDEKATGETLRNQTIAAEVIFAGLLWYSYSLYRNPPELTPVAFQLVPASPEDGQVQLAISYSW